MANDIYELMHNELGFMEQVEIRNTCINLALYFEDLHSETHLFETFTRLYKRMFGMYVPFYQSVDANSPDAGLDAMKFMLWHSIVSERGSRVLNPTNDALAAMSEKLLILWNESKAHIDPNEGLADYLYAKETQFDRWIPTRIMVNPNLWDSKEECIKKRVVCDEKMRQHVDGEVKNLRRFIEDGYEKERNLIDAEWPNNIVDRYYHPEDYIEESVEERHYTLLELFDIFWISIGCRKSERKTSE